MLLKLKASSLSGTPCLHRQESLTDKHGRLKQSNGQASQHSLQLESRDDVARQQQTVDAPVRCVLFYIKHTAPEYVHLIIKAASTCWGRSLFSALAMSASCLQRSMIPL